MHPMDKVNKWEDFNSDEEKRGKFHLHFWVHCNQV